MPRTNLTTQLGKMLAKLMAQRKKHLAVATRSLAKVAEMDQILAQAGIHVDGGAKAAGKAAKPGRKAGGRRKRGVFKETAEEFVLGLVKSGKATATAEINNAWKEARRGGKADNTLTKLVKGKQLKRAKVKGGRGSAYSVA